MKHITDIVQEVVIEPISLFMADPERRPQAFTIYHPYQSTPHVDEELTRIFSEMSLNATWKRRKDLKGTHTQGMINSRT